MATIEEKAKAYDKAIERAKSKIKNDKDHVLYEEDVIEIFPELQESEDERMIKSIIKALRSHSNSVNSLSSDGFKMEDVIAWLEKQGEKPQRIVSAEAKEAMYDKPAWSEEDERMIDNIIDYMKPMPIFFESTKGKSGKEYTQKFVKNAINWLKSLKERIGE